MRRILVTVLLIAPLYLFAQQDNYALRNYTAAHGIPQSQINGMIEDANGYLWLATAGGGIARFDGQHFHVYTTLDGLLNNIVSDIKADRDGNIWTVHPQGISKFNGAFFKTFQLSTDSNNRNIVRRAMVFKDTVFLLLLPGVMGKIYKDSVFYWKKEYQPNAQISRIFQFETGELCIVMKDNRVFIKNSTGNHHIGDLPKGYVARSSYRDRKVLKIEAFSLHDRILKIYEVDVTQMTVQESKKISEHVILYCDADKNELWATNDHNNLLKINTITGREEVIIANRTINYVKPDSEGNIWIGSSGAGLYKYYHRDFTKVGPENMVGVMSVLHDNESTWTGSISEGLLRFRLGDNKPIQYNNKEQVYCLIQAPDGTIWAGGDKGLGKYNKDTDKFTWLTTKDGLISNVVFTIQIDERNNLWIGTRGGLSYYNGKEFKNFGTEQGLLIRQVNCSFYSKKDKTLFIGNELGINTISHGKVDKIYLREFVNTSILSINPYRDSLLLMGSGGGGFLVYDPVTQKSQRITTHDGLASDFIYFIVADEQDVIWVGTEKGINRMVLNKDLSIVENIHFDSENGLSGVETNQSAFSVKGSERLFGLVDGLYRFNKVTETQQESFDIHLTDVDIYYGEESARNYTDSLSGFFKIPYRPVFPHDKNHLTFSFNRVDKLYPKSVKFRYKLINYDKSWSKTSSLKEVTYSNLSPGKYEFVVMATNRQGGWSQKELRYPFIIRAAFYQTATFWVIACLLFVGSIVLIFYLRMRYKLEKAMLREKIRLHEQESLRKEIARDFHDEMGNQLTRIINYVSLLKLNGNVSNQASRTDLYTKVENSAKYLYTGTRDFIWSIDPVNDELSKLFIHIRDFGEKLFEEKEIKFRAFNDVRASVKLPYGFSREANLIFKEAMTNTFKSSHAKNASFSLLPHENGFEFVFEDDGVGFHEEEKERSNGLKNIQERAEKLKAILSITSEKGKGTRISLKFQFEKKIKYVSTS